MEIETFQFELTVIGGLNERRQPNLRVVRGDQEMKFACGRMIPKYNVPGGAVRKEHKKFRLRNIFTNELKECSFEQAKIVWEKTEALDLSNVYIAETCREVSITVTARDGYFIEQYYPPDKIKDTPESWEAHRYAMWFDEEKGKEVWTDMVGPFPFEGQYEVFAEGPELTSKLLKAVRRAWQRRDQWKQTKSAQLMVKDVIDEATEAEIRAEQEVSEMLKSAILPHAFRGLYLNTPSRFIHQTHTLGEQK